MKRPHLFELMDQPWYPRIWRDLQTEAMEFANADVFTAAVPLIVKALNNSGETRVVDLCSGSAGPWTRLHGRVREQVQTLEVTLTDAFPHGARKKHRNADAEGSLAYHETPVRADCVPAELSGMRTMFSGFHHLRPQQAVAVLRDASDKGFAVGIFEHRSARERLGSLLALLLLVPLAPVLGWLCSMYLLFRIKPLSLRRLLWTCLLPVVPLASTWDGVVSSLRIYTEQELRGMAEGLGGSQYEWDVGQQASGRFRSTYLLGYPKSAWHREEKLG